MILIGERRLEMTISVSLNSESFEQVIYSREDDFEQLVAKNAETIFGNKAIYINAKRKITTSALGGTIPDGFLIDLSDLDDPQFYLVEVELQKHEFFSHILPQITKFFAFYRNPCQWRNLTDQIDLIFRQDSSLMQRIKNLIGEREIYKFLKDILENSQNILIIIDGLKPEFEEIMNTYTDTWGKFVKVQIVNHFRRGENNIITVEPPFQNLAFGDAVSPSPEEETLEPSPYTEEILLQNRQPEVVEIYRKLKQEFINVKNTLWFNPTKYYIGVGDRKQFAYIVFQKKKVRLILLLPEDQTRHMLQSGHHTVISHPESTRRYWGGNNPNCSVEISDTAQWDEIQKLLARLVEKYQET
jgi:predicted transport protein